MLLQEFISGSFATLRIGIVARVFQDALHGVSRDRPNAEFLELAENTRVAPLVLFGQLQDQPTDLFRRAAAATLDRLLLAALLLSSNPLQELTNSKKRVPFRRESGTGSFSFFYEQPRQPS